MTRSHALALAVCMSLLTVAGTARAANATDVDRIMALLPQWVGGQYSTRAQFDADQASSKPDKEKHRLMFQYLQRVNLPGYEGLVFFEQGSSEGATDPEQVWRAGFLQFIPDRKLGVVRQRELHVKNKETLVNAYLTPEKFKTVTPDMLESDPACDFLLKLSPNRKEIGGPIPAKACKVTNPGSGKAMYADDRIVVKAGEYWFLGRYRDEAGQVVWGNEGGDLNKLVRIKTP